MWLFLALLIVPLIEIGLFIEVGGLIGLWPTLLIVVLTAVIGTMLLRAQGLAAMRDVQSKLRDGRNPSAALAHGALILVAGVVLLTPGFFTDAIGFLLLVPPVRAAVIAALADRMVTSVHVHASRGPGGRGSAGPRPGPSRPGGQTVEGEWEDVTPPDDAPDAERPERDPQIGRPSGWTQGPRD